MMSADTIPDFLAEQRDAAPEELQGLVLEFEDFWERKLWHQLTEALLKFFQDPRSEPQRLPFYKVFILKFADKINQLKLVELALPAAEGCDGKPLPPHYTIDHLRSTPNSHIHQMTRRSSLSCRP